MVGIIQLSDPFFFFFENALFIYLLFFQVKSKLKGHSKRITGLAFSHALNVLVSSGADSQVVIFLC